MGPNKTFKSKLWSIPVCMDLSCENVPEKLETFKPKNLDESEDERNEQSDEEDQMGDEEEDDDDLLDDGIIDYDEIEEDEFMLSNFVERLRYEKTTEQNKHSKDVNDQQISSNILQNININSSDSAVYPHQTVFENYSLNSARLHGISSFPCDYNNNDYFANGNNINNNLDSENYNLNTVHFSNSGYQSQDVYKNYFPNSNEQNLMSAMQNQTMFVDGSNLVESVANNFYSNLENFNYSNEFNPHQNQRYAFFNQSNNHNNSSSSPSEYYNNSNSIANEYYNYNQSNTILQMETHQAQNQSNSSANLYFASQAY